MDLLFFTSPIGLGHASRDVAISAELAMGIRFVSGQPASKMIADNGFPVEDLYRHDGFYIDGNGELKHPFRWIMQYWSYYKKCKEIALRQLEKEKPKLVIADEDFAATNIALKKSIPNVVITDILESRFTDGFISSTIERKMNKTMKDMMDRSSLVIIPDFGSDHDNFAYVGPIVRPTYSTREELRERFGFHKKTILVTVGGTSAGTFLLKKAMNAFTSIRDRIDADMVVVSGPSVQVQSKDVRNIGYVKDLHEMIYASDLLISLAGRSTIDEAIAYGTPAIFIPIKNHFEQEENANRYGYKYEDVTRLDELIVRKLDQERKPRKACDGAQKAAELISSLIR